ncbi:hypothetical protein NCG89_01820 [Spongiibacter taiwanensis]|uniref:DUF6763 family protein n=1 Tax=Spongiibacter taiwanensis TaxID=1748242 RepID=UPI002034ADA3|nr:DUF6763 family protein [Spongiibacter taiwanensis]USA43536.1 hypothetical protein NCG89_01820 [Spongiibacter taiwanensis]
MAAVRPQVGRWYKELEMGQVFEVVAIDDMGTVDAQLIDGELCEYDSESWRQLTLEAIEEPEDWRNAFELSDDDFRDWDDTIVPETWTSPLNEIESDVINGILDDY